MTFEAALLFTLLAAALVMFAFEWWSVDVVTLLLVAALVLSGILTPTEAFSGFASEIIIILCSIFVLSGAVAKSGIMERLGAALWRLTGRSESLILASVMVLSATISAFVSNTNATAVLTPAVLELSRKSSIGAGRLLMPLAFASMLGGTCTLIGTSTNLAASGLMAKMGLAPLGLFEFSAVGVVVAVSGILFMVVLGRRLLPESSAGELSEKFEIEDYLAEVRIKVGSGLEGLALRESPLSQLGITVLAIVRGGEKTVAMPESRLREGDLLLVEAPRDSLMAAAEEPGLGLGGATALAEKDLSGKAIRLAEALLMPGSTLIGRTLREREVRRRFGASVLALYRRGRTHSAEVSTIPLKVGDVLLLAGPPERLSALRGDSDLRVLEEIPHPASRRRRGPVALGALTAAIAAGGLGLMPLSVALLLAAVAVVLVGGLTPEEVYRLIDWRLIVLIGGMTSFGLALQKSQGAEILSGWIAAGIAPFGLYAVLAAFGLLTMLLTQPMSNAAAALVVLPVALSTAGELGIDPRTLVVMVVLAASLSFIAPLEPACLLVYGPGRYRFRDFVVAGLPLSLIAAALLTLLVPVFWPPY